MEQTSRADTFDCIGIHVVVIVDCIVCADVVYDGGKRSTLLAAALERASSSSGGFMPFSFPLFRWS